MRHLKDINMKKATLLLVMICCTIGLGRVGAENEGGEVSNEAPVEGTVNPAAEKPAEQQTSSTRNFRETFEKFKASASITGFKDVSAKIDEPSWNIGIPLTDYIGNITIKEASLPELTLTLETLQEKVIKDLIRALALGLVNSQETLSAVTKRNNSNNQNSPIVMLIQSANPKGSEYELLTSKRLEEHIEDYSKAFREISGLDIATLVVRKGRFKGLKTTLTKKEQTKLIADKMCQILLSCLALKSATLNGLPTSSSLDALNKEFLEKTKAFDDVMQDMKNLNKIDATLLNSVLEAFEALIQTAFKCAGSNNHFLDGTTIIPKIQEALGVTKMQKNESWFTPFVRQPGTPQKQKAENPNPIGVFRRSISI